jgi:hypothetical protein
VKTVSGTEFEVNDKLKLDGKTYWEMRPEMILMPYTSWVKLKAWIIKECKVTGACDSRISSWDRTLETIDEMTKHK